MESEGGVGSSPDIDGPVPLVKDDLQQSFHTLQADGVAVNWDFCVLPTFVLQLRWEAHQQSLPVFNPSLGVPRESMPHPGGPTQPKLATHKHKLFLEEAMT